MTKQFKAYRFVYPLWRLVLLLLFPTRVIGREHIPAGAAVVCANHSSNWDAFFFMYATGRDNHLRILTKIEVMRLPVIGPILRALGMITVDRSVADITAMRESMAHLKAGGKLGIFPVGHRVSAEEAAEAKTGAARMADRTGAPLLPVFIPYKKRLFRLNRLIIGEPFAANPEHIKLTAEDYARVAENVMERVRSLEP